MPTILKSISSSKERQQNLLSWPFRLRVTALNKTVNLVASFLRIL